MIKINELECGNYFMILEGGITLTLIETLQHGNDHSRLLFQTLYINLRAINNK